MITNRCGVVAIIGRPNTGKSTLLNYILKDDLAIVSRVPQTTRHLIRGILTEKRGQIIFVDTPGIHKPKHGLGKRLNLMAYEAVRGADVLLHLADSSRAPGDEEDMVLSELSHQKKKIVLVLNKMDLGAEWTDDYLRLWEKDKGRPIAELTASLTIMPISALKGTNINRLLDVLFSLLPPGQNLYPDDMITDFPRRLAFADIIRKNIFESLRQEVPHSIAVLVEEILERSDKLTYIKAVVFVERPSQKAIVIGARARALKNAGTLSRKELEDLLGKKVYLELKVEVREGWKNDAEALRQLGYLA